LTGLEVNLLSLLLEGYQLGDVGVESGQGDEGTETESG
jgi:hypothetical protein